MNLSFYKCSIFFLQQYFKNVVKNLSGPHFIMLFLINLDIIFNFLLILYLFCLKYFVFFIFLFNH